MSTVTAPKSIEDILPYAVPFAIALAGFNWAGIIPGNNNPFLVATAFGFIAKLLYGVQQEYATNKKFSWEDLIPTLIIAFGFLATTLSSTNDPAYLAYGTGFGFVVKSLGYFSDRSHPIEDILLAVGSFVTLFGVYSGHQGIVSAGALLSLVGKTIPSFVPPGSQLQPPQVATPPPSPPAA